MRKRKIFAAIILLIILGLAAIIIVDLVPILKEVITNTGDEADLARYIDAYGAQGVPILLGLQALQIIVPFIPSAAIQVLTGLCYGAYWGTLINLAGVILGNILVFTAARQLSSLLGPLFKRKNKHEKFLSKERLEKIRRPELVAFFFFLIPGIPNGIVPYVFAETDISLGKYILAAVTGSVPSTFLCAYLGNSVSGGQYTVAILIAAAAIVIVAAALLFRKRIMEKITRGKT